MNTLTKYAYLEPYKEASTAEDLAYIFNKIVIARHGIPDKIVLDRDKLFTSQFWQSLMDQIETKQRLSTSYHPQTDGQTERTNQTIEQYLRYYLNYEQNNWVSLLPIAQFAFNNSAAMTGISPFFANYGKHPSIEKTPKGVKPLSEKAHVSIQKIQELHKALKEDLEFIAQRTAKHANKKRSEGPDLRKGGIVYLLRKNIKTKRPSDKLDHTKLGPFKIQEKLGPITFKLELPPHMRIHPVFHISLLEPATGNAKQEPIHIDEEIQKPLYKVDQVMGHKLVKDERWYLIH